MKTPMIGLALFLVAGFWSEAARAQTTQGAPDLVLFKKAYQALDEKLPTGRRVVVMADPFLNGPPARQSEVGQANRAFASAIGLASAPLADVLTCTTTDDCTLDEDVAATVSFRMASRQADSAVVEVATRKALDSEVLARHPQMPWRALIALYAIHLVRRNGAWEVVSVSPRAEGHW